MPTSESIEVRHTRFEGLALPLARMLYATAYRLTGEGAAAEDLVQETYVRGWQKFDEYQPDTNFKAWIFQILVFLAKNARRKQQCQPVDTEVLKSVPAGRESEVNRNCPPAGGWSALYELWVDDEFKNALDRLDEPRRTALMLVTLAELSYQECADVMGVPLGTVMSLIHRARKQLQADLQEYARDRRLTSRAEGGRR